MLPSTSVLSFRRRISGGGGPVGPGISSHLGGVKKTCTKKKNCAAILLLCVGIFPSSDHKKLESPVRCSRVNWLMPNIQVDQRVSNAAGRSGVATGLNRTGNSWLRICDNRPHSKSFVVSSFKLWLSKCHANCLTDFFFFLLFFIQETVSAICQRKQVIHSKTELCELQER